MEKPNDAPINLSAIQKDFQVLRDEVTDMFKHLKTDARHGLQDAVIGVNDEMHKLFPKAAVSKNKTMHFIKQELREHPISSAIILISLGFLGSRILSK